MFYRPLVINIENLIMLRWKLFELSRYNKRRTSTVVDQKNSVIYIGLLCFMRALI